MNAILETETCIPPLSLRRLQISERFCLKIFASDNKFIIDSIAPGQALQLPAGPYISGEQLIGGYMPDILRLAVHVNNLVLNSVHRNPIWPLYTCKYDSLTNTNFNICYQKVNNQRELLQFL